MATIRRTIHESLPYIDPEPTPAQRAAAEALIAAELESLPTGDPHPDLPPAHQPALTPALAAELARIAGSPDPAKPTRLSAIDTRRYELQDDDDEGGGGGAGSTTSSLAAAHTAASHIRLRRHHLALLDTPEGRNAWLVANWQLEAELRALEAELAAARRDVEVVAIHRRRAQEAAAGELKSLEESWKSGLRHVVEVEVATQKLRTELQAKRNELLTAEAAAVTATKSSA